MTRVWVYAEIDAGGAVDATTLGLLTRARSIADDVAAVSLGRGALESAELLGEYGAATVFAGGDAFYDDHPGESAAWALAGLVAEHAPDAVLFGSSYRARDVAGRLQALLGVTLVANVSDVLDVHHVRHVVALLLTPGRPGNLRGGIGGDKVVDVELDGPRPRLVLVRPQAFKPEPGGLPATVVPVELASPDSRRRARTRERYEETGSGPQLEDARVVVAGGRGLGAPENFRLLEELADAIGNAAVGATRPVVDAGWAPFSRQIGQTGKTVRPDVYLAVGISGAPQHMVGMKDAAVTVAINTDPNAPIFQHADLGVVGDALEILPALVRVLEGTKAAG